MCIRDRVCSYGTANMDIRSFELNFEVNAVIYDEETTQELENIFLEDLNCCREITMDIYRRRSLIIRAKEQCSKMCIRDSLIICLVSMKSV